MRALLSLIILIIDIVVVLDILKTVRDTEKKMLWIIVVVFLPVVGPALYYLVGRK